VRSEVEKTAHALGRELLVLNAGTPSEIDAVFATVRQRGVSALVVAGDNFFAARNQQIVALAARDAIPAIYATRDFVTEGELMSYGNDVSEAYRLAGSYTARILKGEKPGDMPIDQTTKFEFVINLRTAQALGSKISDNLLSLADEVIE